MTTLRNGNTFISQHFGDFHFTAELILNAQRGSSTSPNNQSHTHVISTVHPVNTTIVKITIPSLYNATRLGKCEYFPSMDLFLSDSFQMRKQHFHCPQVKEIFSIRTHFFLDSFKTHFRARIRSFDAKSLMPSWSFNWQQFYHYNANVVRESDHIQKIFPKRHTGSLQYRGFHFFFFKEFPWRPSRCVFSLCQRRPPSRSFVLSHHTLKCSICVK